MQSVTFEEFPQKHGRKYVKFTLVDDAGITHYQWSLVKDTHDPADDIATLSAHWDAMLIEGEISQNVEEILGG